MDFEERPHKHVTRSEEMLSMSDANQKFGLPRRTSRTLIIPRTRPKILSRNNLDQHLARRMSGMNALKDTW
jgi:hypothetical protein